MCILHCRDSTYYTEQQQFMSKHTSDITTLTFVSVFAVSSQNISHYDWIWGHSMIFLERWNISVVLHCRSEGVFNSSWSRIERWNCTLFQKFHFCITWLTLRVCLHFFMVISWDMVQNVYLHFLVPFLCTNNCSQ